MSSPKEDHRFVTLTDQELKWLRSELRERGERDVAKAVGLSHLTVLRLAAGTRVQRLTARCFRQHLATLPVDCRQ